MDIVDKLKAFLREKRWKAAQLGRAASIGPNRAADIMARRFRPASIDYLLPIAKAMQAALPDREVTIEWLVDENQKYPPPPRTGREAVRITEDQERVLMAARLIGEETALRRIMLVPDDSPLPSGDPSIFAPVPSTVRDGDGKSDNKANRVAG